MTLSLRAFVPVLFVIPECLLATCPDVRRWPGHPIYNSSADYVQPPGRRVVTVLASADAASIDMYGHDVVPLFEALHTTSQLAFLMGGCSGLMGSPAPFCTKGALGSTCNLYDGFWKKEWLDSRQRQHCIQDCEWHLGMKVHLVASKELEEEIITGGAGAGKGDAFLVLPGGIGTTRELYDVLQANFEYGGVNKPVFCFNIGGGTELRAGFYGGVVAWLLQLYDHHLLSPYPGSSGSSLFISSNATVLAAAIDAWVMSGTLPEDIRLENLINVTHVRRHGDVLV